MSDLKFDRRHLLGATALGGAALSLTSLGAQGDTSRTPTIKWRMVTAWPKGAPGVGTAADRLAARIEQMSGGRLEIDVYGAGELVPPFEVFDAVANGVAEMGHGASHFWAGKNPAFHYFAGVPFGFTAIEQVGWILHGGGQALWDEAYAPFNLKGFIAGSSGVQAGGWFRQPIETLSDLQGLKMRIAGLGGEVLRRLGVNVTLLAPGEIFGALQSGAIDAAEWVGPWNDIAFGLPDIAKHYYLPAFHEPGPILECLVNQDALARLPADLQQIVEGAAHATALENLGLFAFHNAQAFATLEALGVTIHRWPDELAAAFSRVSADVLKEVGETNELTRRIAASHGDFLAKAKAYSAYSDLEILRLRAGMS